MNFDLSDIFQNIRIIDFSTPSWDLFILVFFVVTAFIYGFSLGRDRIIAILISIYMALAVVANAPFVRSWGATISINDAFVARITTFVGLFLLTFFLLSHSGILKTLGHVGSRGNWWQIILFSFLHVGLLISTALSFLPIEFSNNLAPITRAIFISDIARFIWLVAPILVMALVKAEKKS